MISTPALRAAWVILVPALLHLRCQLIAGAEEPVKETKSGMFKVADGTTVRIYLSSPDIEIEDNEEEQEWQGKYLNFSFEVMFPDDYKKRQILFTVSVFFNDVIATRLKFIVKCSSLFEQKVKVAREDVLSAFISYASKDRQKVAAIIQGMKKARPEMDIFFDVESLRSEENWEKALYHEIEKRDILFLFWSQFSRESKWVDAEWRYAMANKGIECIEPVPIDPPSVCRLRRNWSRSILMINCFILSMRKAQIHKIMNILSPVFLCQ